MSTSRPSKAVKLSEKLYGRLLIVYPQAHREEYGPCMAQLFRDQCRDAWAEARNWALLKLWFRVLPDLLSTSILERLAALNERRSMFHRILSGRLSAPMFTFLSVCIPVFLLVFGSTALFSFLAPDTYCSTARVKVERPATEAQTRVETQQSRNTSDPYSGGYYDPYFIQTEFEVMQSEVVLGKVVDSLDLNHVWAKKYGSASPLKSHESMELLRARIDLRPVRSTTLIAIRAYSDQPEEAAKLANAIAEEYRAYRFEQDREWVLSNIHALEDLWKQHDTELRKAAADVAALRADLKVPIPEPSEGELFANYRSYAEAKQRLEMQRKRLEPLLEKISQQQTDLSLPKWGMVQIIDHGIANHRPVRPNRPLNLFLGALLGIVLGSVAGGSIAGISFLSRRGSPTKPGSPRPAAVTP